MWVMAMLIYSPHLYLLVYLFMTTHLSIVSACEPDVMLLISPRDSRVAYMTIMMFIPNTIGALTAPLGGLLAQRLGANLVFALATAISVVSLGFFVLLEFMRVPESSVAVEKA